ncbi:unnamed protein product [Sphagnum balticum]
MDSASTLDLIDYWNLRALGWGIIPIPIQWQTELLERCKSFVVERVEAEGQERGDRAIRGVLLVKARSIEKSKAEEFQKAILSDPKAIGVETNGSN